MNSLEEILRFSQKKLFKRLCKKFKNKILISKDNFILVHGEAPIMLNGINLTKRGRNFMIVRKGLL